MGGLEGLYRTVLDSVILSPGASATSEFLGTTPHISKCHPASGLIHPASGLNAAS